LKPIRLYVDGGCFPNPGEKAIAVVTADGEVLEAKRTGYGTNNEAEYEACIRGLEIAIERGWKDIEVCLDSQIVIYQLMGKWKAQDKFHHYIDRFNDLSKQFDSLQVTYVRSRANLADAEVKKLLDINEIPMFKITKEELSSGKNT